MTLLDVLENILINLFSSQLYVGKTRFFEKIKFWIFRKKLLTWTQKYILMHDGTVLTTSDFEAFLRYHNLIENIFNHVASTDTNETKDTFISNQIKLFHQVQKHPEDNKFDTDDILRGFIVHFYNEINRFFINNLSQDGKYVISRMNEGKNQIINEVEAIKQINQKGLEDIKVLLSKSHELDDPEIVWSIYQKLSTLVLNGMVSDVIQMYPLIKGKSKDLEIGISYLLGLFSDEEPFKCNFSEFQDKVLDDRIYCHGCRVFIYVNKWRNNSEFLKDISDRDVELQSIAKALDECNQEELYTVSKTEQDGITYFTYSLNNNHPDENWLLTRICLLDMLRLPFYIEPDNIVQLIDSADNVIDKIIILERKILEIYNKFELDNDIVKQLYNETLQMVQKTDRLAVDIKTIIFEVLLRASLLISEEEAEKAASTVPTEVQGNKNIDLLLLQVKQEKGCSSIEEVISTCNKYGEYWLFNNLLAENIETDPYGTKMLIEKYKYVIELDASIFLIYVQLINTTESEDAAIELLEKYKSQYDDIIEYWIERLRIRYSEKELGIVLINYNLGKLKHISPGGSLAFVKLLVRHKKYEEAIDIVKRHEISANITPEMLKLKAYALCNLKREIEALNIYTKLFNLGDCSEEVVYYILALSCNNHRSVQEDIVLFAEKSDDPKVLMAAASVCVLNNNIDEAYKLNIKAMLRTMDDDSDVFNQFLGLELEFLEEHRKEDIVNSIDVDTMVNLSDESGRDTKIYAIHSLHYLPQETFLWGNATHIYKETAITLGLLRKKVGDSILIENQQYKIVEILPVRTYFFRLSMEKVIAKGKAKVLSMPVTSEEKLDVKRLANFVKEVIGDDKKQFTWLEQYKDLSQIPVTFYFSKRFVRVTYSQLVSAVLEDKNILYREDGRLADLSCDKYVFSYAALVLLFKLGWTCSGDESKYSIPSSLRKIIAEETEQIIRENNRDHVSFIGISDDQLYLAETSEINKEQYMQEAVAFRVYSERFSVLDNEADIQLEDNHHFDLKDVLGIADYDAIAIAKNSNRVLVSAEVMISGISHMPEVDIGTIGIADFLTKESKDVNELLEYVKKMVEYKCTVPFTVNTIYRVIEFFENSETKEKQNIIKKWSNILQIPLKDETYKTVMLVHVQNCINSLRNETDRFTPIGECLLYSWLKYSGHKIAVSISDDGELITQIVRA